MHRLHPRLALEMRQLLSDTNMHTAPCKQALRERDVALTGDTIFGDDQMVKEHGMTALKLDVEALYLQGIRVWIMRYLASKGSSNH